MKKTKPLFTAAALLLATTARAQQGPGGAPPPNRSTPAESGERRETWNDRVSVGPAAGAAPEFPQGGPVPAPAGSAGGVMLK